MGDNSHLHHLHLHDLEKLDGHRDVEAHAYHNSRYKVRIEPHDGKDHSHDEPTQESFEMKIVEKGVKEESPESDDTGQPAA